MLWILVVGGWFWFVIGKGKRQKGVEWVQTNLSLLTIHCHLHPNHHSNLTLNCNHYLLKMVCVPIRIYAWPNSLKDRSLKLKFG